MFAVRVKNEIQKAEGGVGGAIKSPSLNTSVKAPSGGTGNFSSSSPQVQNQTPKGVSNAAKTPSSPSSNPSSSTPKPSNPLPSPSSLSKPVSFAPTNTNSSSGSGGNNKPTSSFSAPKVEPINTGFTPQKQNVSPNAAKPANSPILTSMAGEQKLDSLLGQKNITKPDNPSSTSTNTPSAPPKAGQTGTGQLVGGAKPNTPPSSAQGAMKTQPFSPSVKPNTASTVARVQGGKGPSIVPPSQASPQDVASQAPTLSSLAAGKPESPKPTQPNQKPSPIPVSFAPQAKTGSTRLNDPSKPDALSRVTAPDQQQTGGEIGDMPRDIQVGMDGKQYVTGEARTPTAPTSPNVSSGAKQAASSGFQAGQRFSNMLLHGSGSEMFTAPTQAASSALQRQATKDAQSNQQAQNTYQTQQQTHIDQMKQHQQQLNQAKNAQDQAFKGGSAMLRVSFVSQENQDQQDQQDLIKGLDSVHKAMFRRVNFDAFGAGSCGEYFGTPFYAKALELAAKQERLNAERAKLNLLEDEGKADKGFKKLQQKSCELDMQGSLLRAELLEYRAKAVRQDDKTQKSLKAASVPRSWQGRVLTGAEVQKGWSEDYQSKLKPFVGTPFYAKALECIAEIEKARSAMEAYWLKRRNTKSEDVASISYGSGGYNEFGLNFRESKKKEKEDSEITKLRQAEGEADLAFANMQAEFFKWAAENLRKQDTAQKAHTLNNLAKSLYPMPPDQYTGIGSTFVRKDPFETETQSRCEPMDVSQPFIPLEQAKAWLDAILEASR